MFAAIVAVLGTLAGAVLTGTLAHLSQRAQRRADADAARRGEGLAAVTDLVTALTDHRRAMWVREDLRLRGEDWTQARTESHATRSAITAPLLRVQLLLPSLAPAAQAAARATYGLRDADGQTPLAAARLRAIQQTDALVESAGTALAA
ncbi:protein kilB [Streptomyces sp. WAC06128]|uniref:protein kilB n=1 Tax=Streptomyces sp. WAC06128 TaxID=2487426 RepID=UPI000FA69D17|nr:protein kilB [Streptomyces sp. WAC06128]RSS67358.1 protein kilB [Streptomyces sp. WAC06128]